MDGSITSLKHCFLSLKKATCLVIDLVGPNILSHLLTQNIFILYQGLYIFFIYMYIFFIRHIIGRFVKIVYVYGFIFWIGEIYRGYKYEVSRVKKVSYSCPILIFFSRALKSFIPGGRKGGWFLKILTPAFFFAMTNTSQKGYLCV